MCEINSRTNFVLFFLLTFYSADAKRSNQDRPTVLPRFAHSHLSNHTARVGNEVQFSCTVDQLGDYRVAWLHSEKGTLAVYPAVITQNNRITVSYDNRATYHLRLQAVQESDAGKYICQINTGPVISISGTLSVVVPPDIVDEESSSDTLATEGMRVLLNCRARGNPEPTISWRREDDKNIQLCNTATAATTNKGETKKVKECKEVRVHYGNELELSQVSRFDSGVYLCLASNHVPPTVSKRVRLYVDFSPTLWISHQLVGAEVGSSAEIECLTAAHPPSLNFWSRDGNSYLSPKDGKYLFENRKGEPSFYNVLMKIRILNITEEDFGVYRCMAKNSQGETDGEINLYEVPRASTTTTQSYFEEFGWDSRKDIDNPGHLGRLNKTMLVLLEEGEEGSADHDGGTTGTKTRPGNGKKHHRKKNNRKQRNKNKQDNGSGAGEEEDGMGGGDYIEGGGGGGGNNPDHPSYHLNVASLSSYQQCPSKFGFILSVWWCCRSNVIFFRKST